MHALAVLEVVATSQVSMQQAGDITVPGRKRPGLVMEWKQAAELQIHTTSEFRECDT